MDIFPLDAVKPDTLRRHCALVGALTGARKTKLKVDLGRIPPKKRVVYKALSLLPMPLLNKGIDRATGMYNRKGTGYCYEVCNSNRKFKPLPAATYEELIELPFRDGSFLAVKEYDAFLASRFGDGYMEKLPLEEERHPSHCANIYIKE